MCESSCITILRNIFFSLNCFCTLKPIRHYSLYCIYCIIIWQTAFVVNDNPTHAHSISSAVANAQTMMPIETMMKTGPLVRSSFCSVLLYYDSYPNNNNKNRHYENNKILKQCHKILKQCHSSTSKISTQRNLLPSALSGIIPNDISSNVNMCSNTIGSCLASFNGLMPRIGNKSC